MASIVRKGNSLYVTYRYGGKQLSESGFSSATEARTRKNEIEYLMSVGKFVPPSPLTVAMFFEKYIKLYGANKWSYSTYTSAEGLIRNYINPGIGNILIKKVTTEMIDEFHLDLRKDPAKRRYGKSGQKVATDKVVLEIYLLLHSAFKQAVIWKDVPRSPIYGAVRPPYKKKKTKYWDTETAKRALKLAGDDDFGICLNVALALSMRIGEILGLRWDCIDFGDPENHFKGAKVYVACELKRIGKDAVAKLNRPEDDIFLVFPEISEGKNSTLLVLKKPKTESSIRTIWVPPSLAEKLWRHKLKQEELKGLLGAEYVDFGLVFTSGNGRPHETGFIYDELKRFTTEHHLPKVVFHSFRHTSTSLKLKISGGDIKSVQGDTGHAQAAMVTDTYAEIMDSDREKVAAEFEKAFYANGDTESRDEIEEFVERVSVIPNGLEKLIQATLKAVGKGAR
jgi:integrase